MCIWIYIDNDNKSHGKSAVVPPESFQESGFCVTKLNACLYNGDATDFFSSYILHNRFSISRNKILLKIVLY